jgi:hypothetical protein
MTSPLYSSTLPVSYPSYLNGAWSGTGWWYYFPLAFGMKTPLPFLVFLGAGIALAVRSRREVSFGEMAAWGAAVFYFLCATRSTTDVGVRHVLPVYPLVTIAAACSLARWANQPRTAQRNWERWAVAALPASALAVVLLAYPYFICYMNPLAGGTEQGYKHLLDSSYDWGQDAIRLKKFLDERGISRIYLSYFGTQAAIDYYRIANDPVSSETAKQIQQGWLVVSVQTLMQPQWQWLRGSHQPAARVGYTLFVYQIGNPQTAARPGH